MIKTYCKCGKQLNEGNHTQYPLRNKEGKMEILCLECFSKEAEKKDRLYKDIICL